MHRERGVLSSVAGPHRRARAFANLKAALHELASCDLAARGAEGALEKEHSASQVRAVLLLDNDTIEFITDPAVVSTPPLTPAEEAVLLSGGIDTDTLRRGPELRARVEQKTRSVFRDLIAHSLTVAEAAAILDVNTSRIRQRLEAGTLYGFKDGNSWRLPRFQFTGPRRGPKGTVPNIEKVLARLPRDLSPIAVERWFCAPNADLYRRRDDEERPMTPIEWLNAGEAPEIVANLASQL